MRTERADINNLLQQMRQMQDQMKSAQGMRESTALQGMAPPAGLGQPTAWPSRFSRYRAKPSAAVAADALFASRPAPFCGSFF